MSLRLVPAVILVALPGGCVTTTGGDDLQRMQRMQRNQNAARETAA